MVIDGPETVLAGEQARYRVRAVRQPEEVASWSVGGGAVAHSPDPAYPDDLLLIAGHPGTLLLTVRVRDGMMERRGHQVGRRGAGRGRARGTVPAPAVPPGLGPDRGGRAGHRLRRRAGRAGQPLVEQTSSRFTVPLAALLGMVALARGPGTTRAAGRATVTAWATTDTARATTDTARASGTGRPRARTAHARPHRARTPAHRARGRTS